MSDDPPSAETASDASAWRPPVVILAVLALVATAATALLRPMDGYLVDDAFITFRYARNWSEWGLPVFNAYELAEGGVRVEGFSNTLWTGLLALLHGGGLSLVEHATTVQLVLAALTLVAVTLGAARLGLGPVGVIGAPLVLATAAPFVAWASGGMETSLFTCLLAFMVLGLGRAMAESRRSWAPALFAIGVVLVRAEGIAWVLGCTAAMALSHSLHARRGSTGGAALSSHPALRVVGLALLALVLHVAWRMHVFGDWLPNTAVAKSGGGTAVMGRGARQIGSWALVTLTPIAALLLAVPALLHRAQRARVAATGALGIVFGFAAYNVAVGGDWMPFFRFLAPASPMLALLVAIGADRLPKLAGGLIVATVVGVQPLPLYDIHLAPESIRTELRFRSFKGGYKSEAARIATARVNAGFFGTLGHALAAGTRPGDILAFGAIGSTGWYARDLDFVDRNGLITPAVAAREVKGGRGTAGHEKRVPHAWFLDHGTPRPNLLFASWRDGLFEGPYGPAFEQAKATVRGSGMTGLPAERKLFGRTILRAVPIAAGPVAGKTLLLLERAEPAVAEAFWGRR